MRHDEQVRLMKQLCAQIDAGVNVDAGGLRRLETSTYTDPAQAQREWNEWFRGMPQVIGMSGDLPVAGSFLTNNDVGTPILATRDADGRFRAFVNACRHRSVAVESEERGTRRRFTCPFHAWTYDSGGALVGLPKPEQFGDVAVECMGLVPLPADERHGLLFVHPDPAGVMDLDGLLGDLLGADFATWDLAGLVPLNHDAYDTNCNWKLAMDTFGETYHFAVLHKATLFNTFHGNVQCYDEDGLNHRMILCRRDIDQMRLLPEDEWDISVACLPVYWLFPNVIIMPFRFGCFLVRAYPVQGEPGRHVSRIDFYLKSEVSLGPNGEDVATFIAGVARTFAEIIRDEDYVMSTSQQIAANSGALPEVVFGRNEPALHHFHNTYRAKLGQDPLPLLASIN